MSMTAVLDGSVKKEIFVHARIRIPDFGDLKIFLNFIGMGR
jgi:hypothetical protein